MKNGGGVRLSVIKLPKNSGTPGLPRNVGIQFSRGKYIAFLDSDDLFTQTALEELVTLAEESQADVVHMHNSLVLWGGQSKTEDDPMMTDMDALLNKSNTSLWPPFSASILKKPTFIEYNLEKRLELWFNCRYWWGIYCPFFKRDVLIANQNFFKDTIGAEDMIFNFHFLCVVEKLLDVPNTTYIIRPRAGSISREKQNFDIPKYLHKWLNVLVSGANEFDKIMNHVDFFKNRPDYRYAVIEFFFRQALNLIPHIYSQVPAFRLNDLVKKEFHPDDAVLSAYLFNTVNIQRLHIMRLQQELAKFQRAVQQ